ncbi:MAG TPA: peptidylprolyl isomerase [Candidatus Nanoarchaeia archaeon]|nr:peptidylprolyl isomerase [Candidatus Nanoarchaeia archaeon]
MVIEIGDVVELNYTGTLDDGVVFDSSVHGDHSHPLQFTVGEGQVIKGFDSAVVGMSMGEAKTFTIPAEEAYGMYDEKRIMRVPRSDLHIEQEIKEGMVLGLRSPEGIDMPVKVTTVEKEFVVLDMNHPLAGKNLTFAISIVSVSKK